MDETSDPDQQYNRGPPRRALIAVTSAHAPLYPDGKETGLFVTEALHPFNVFRKVRVGVPAIVCGTDGTGWIRGGHCLGEFQAWPFMDLSFLLPYSHTSSHAPFTGLRVVKDCCIDLLARRLELTKPTGCLNNLIG